MNRIRTAVAATATAAAVLGSTPPAVADHGEMLGSGLTCGAEVAGTAADGGTSYAGVVTGGPWVAPNPDDIVTITCTVLLVSDISTQALAVASSEPSVGQAVVWPQAFASHVLYEPGMTLQSCTEITIRPANGDPVDRRHYDADGDPTNGAQCDTGSTTSTGDGVTIFVAPPHSYENHPCFGVNTPLEPPYDRREFFCEKP